MRTATVLTVSVLLTACVAEPMSDAVDVPTADEVSTARLLSAEEERHTLFVANTASFDVLDNAAKLDRRAATNIVAERPFANLDELDSVSYVGPRAMAKLADYSASNPVYVFGVQEGSAFAAAVLQVANTADQDELDFDVALDRRAAKNIVDGRVSSPYLTLADLDEVSYVAASAMAKLTDYVDVDGDGLPFNTDCDDSDAAILEYGDSAGCAVATCADLLLTRTGLDDGSYWLIDDVGAFEAGCDMTTDGGGWTILTGELLEDRGYMVFDVVSGTPGASAGGSWDTGTGEFELVPENGTTDFCGSVSVRATAELDFEFTEWSGSWTVDTGIDSYHPDDADTVVRAWGDNPSSCTGHMKFGTDLDDSKVGGEWGWDYTPESWTFAQTSVDPTNTIRWEQNDNFAEEAITVYDIGIKVR